MCSNEIKYCLRNITDFCSSGVNNKNIEFRLTEVKAAMRFWWRALNYYDDAQELWDNEKKIFGHGNNIKSPIMFRILNEDIQFNGDYQEHIVGQYFDKEGNKKQRSIKCISSGKKISFEMSLYKRKISENKFTNKTIKFYDSLLRLSFIIGGIGKRSRRGCGAFYIANEDDSDNEVTPMTIYSDIVNFMENIKIDEYYDFSKKEPLIISRKKSDYALEYPYIEEIAISNKATSEEGFYVNKIKKAIDECRNSNINYKISSARLACPVYVTCYGNINRIIPIIVKLHNTSKGSNGDYNDSIYYNKFKEMIL